MLQKNQRRTVPTPDEFVAVALETADNDDDDGTAAVGAFAVAVRDKDRPARRVRVINRDLLWPVTSSTASAGMDRPCDGAAADDQPPPLPCGTEQTPYPPPEEDTRDAADGGASSTAVTPSTSTVTDFPDAAAVVATSAAEAIAAANEVLGPFRLAKDQQGGGGVLLVCLFAAPYRQVRLVRLRIDDIDGSAAATPGSDEGGPEDYHPDCCVVVEPFTALQGAADPALAEARLARALCGGSLTGAAATLVSPARLWIHGGAVAWERHTDTGGVEVEEAAAVSSISNAVVQLNLATGRVSVAVNTSMTVPSPAVVGHAAHAVEGSSDGSVLLLGGRSPDDVVHDDVNDEVGNLSRPVDSSSLCIEPVDDVLVCTVGSSASASCAWQYRRCLGDLPPAAVVSDTARTATVMCGPWCVLLSSAAAAAFVYALHPQRRVWVKLKFPPETGRPSSSPAAVAPAVIAAPSAPGGAIVSYVNGAGHLVSWAAKGLIEACNARATAAVDAAIMRQAAAVPPRRAATPSFGSGVASSVHDGVKPQVSRPARAVTPLEAARAVARLHTLDPRAQHRRNEGARRRGEAAKAKPGVNNKKPASPSPTFPPLDGGDDSTLPAVVGRLHVSDAVRERQEKWREEQLQRRQPLRQFPARVNDAMFTHRFYERPLDHNRHRDRRAEASVDDKYSKVAARSCRKTTDRPELWETLHEDRAHIHRLNKTAAKFEASGKTTGRKKKKAPAGAAEERLYAEGSVQRQRQAEALYAKYVVSPLQDASTPARVRDPPPS